MGREKICGIYKIENLINGKVYIGQSNDIYKRWTEHKCTAFNKNSRSYNILLYKAIRKYGIENFSFEILEKCDEKDLNDLEKMYIKKYRSFVGFYKSKGYNLTLGGEGTRGIKRTDEQLKQMSERMKGRFARGKNPKSKKVVCEDKIFDCIDDCADYYNEPRGKIGSWLRGDVTMPKEWFDKGLRFLDKQMEDYNIRPENYSGKNSPLSMPIICDGTIFYSINEFINKNPDAKCVFAWLNGINSMPKKWEEKGLRYLDGHTDDIIIYQDEEYNDRVHKNRSESHKGHIPANVYKVYCEDIEFNTVSECAQYYGVNAGTMKGWINGNDKMPKSWYDKGLRREDKQMEDYQYSTKSRRVICQNKVFNSPSECAYYYSESDTSLRNWLNKKVNMPKKFYDMKLHYEGDIFEECGYEIQSDYSYNSKIVICDGMEFPNVTACADYYGVNAKTMQQWLNHNNKMPIEFYELKLHYKDENMSDYKCSTKQKRIICEGFVFKSIAECSSYYNVKQSTLSKWLKGINDMPQEFIDKGLSYY